MTITTSNDHQQQTPAAAGELVVVVVTMLIGGTMSLVPDIKFAIFHVFLSYHSSLLPENCISIYVPGTYRYVSATMVVYSQHDL